MINIRQLFRDYNIQYVEKAGNLSQGWISTDCPYCNATWGTFAFNPQSRAANCWRCGKHSFVEALSLILCVTYNEIYTILKKYDSDTTVVVPVVKPVQPNDYTRLGVKCKKQHADYLYERGYDAVYIINKYKLRGTTEASGFGWQNRIVIPIFHNGVEVCFQTRSIDKDEELRYRGCSREKSIIHYKDLLYPELDVDWVVAVEGVMDMYRLEKNAVCTFGTTLSKPQLTALSRYKRVFFASDPSDPRAQDKANTYCRMLGMLGCDAKRLKITTDKKDPGEFTPQDVLDFWGLVECLK